MSGPAPADSEIAWIRDGLARPGKTQRGLAQALGLDPSAISRLLTGSRQLRAAEVPVVAAYLENEVPAGLSPVRTEAGARPGPTSPRPFVAWTGGRDLPVMGTVVAGSDGMFHMNGEVHDYVERPPSLQGVASAYAVYVSDTSMVPRYFPGETLHVHPGRAVTRGDDTFVVVQLKPEAEGEAPRALVKRFMTQTADALTLEQFNPRRELRFPIEEVESVHLIIWAGRG
ncbi:MAG: helix-turn-helix transcriptional regulator [Alphaproteobacteria bacterium]|nr:helix-turn-helix transcriptional regulator [Alphaproteobacteria bacterium]